MYGGGGGGVSMGQQTQAQNVAVQNSYGQNRPVMEVNMGGTQTQQQQQQQQQYQQQQQQHNTAMQTGASGRTQRVSNQNDMDMA